MRVSFLVDGFDLYPSLRRAEATQREGGGGDR
jgi:hypothetical protein